MAFIDIFNFKKYFSKPSDSQVARYGHVNALYDALSNAADNIEIIDVPNGEYTFSMTSDKALVSFHENVSTIPFSYEIFKPTVSESSIIRATLVMFTDNSGSPFIFGDYELSLLCGQLNSGSAVMTYSTSSDVSESDTVKFFIEIINP